MLAVPAVVCVWVRGGLVRGRRAGGLAHAHAGRLHLRAHRARGLQVARALKPCALRATRGTQLRRGTRCIVDAHGPGNARAPPTLRMRAGAVPFESGGPCAWPRTGCAHAACNARRCTLSGGRPHAGRPAPAAAAAPFQAMRGAATGGQGGGARAGEQRGVGDVVGLHAGRAHAAEHLLRGVRAAAGAAGGHERGVGDHVGRAARVARRGRLHLAKHLRARPRALSTAPQPAC